MTAHHLNIRKCFLREEIHVRRERKPRLFSEQRHQWQDSRLRLLKRRGEIREPIPDSFKRLRKLPGDIQRQLFCQCERKERRGLRLCRQKHLRKRETEMHILLQYLRALLRRESIRLPCKSLINGQRLMRKTPARQWIKMAIHPMHQKRSELLLAYQ